MNCLSSSPVLWNSAGKDDRCVFISDLSAHQPRRPEVLILVKSWAQSSADQTSSTISSTDSVDFMPARVSPARQRIDLLPLYWIMFTNAPRT